MALTTAVRLYVNRWLQKVHLRLDTLTLEETERRRLETLEQLGFFEHQVFPLLRGFEIMAFEPILEELSLYASRCNDFEDPLRNDVGYTFDNGYFSSPDAEVVYTIIRKFKPETVVEVGSGHSTKVIRQAVLDGNLNTCLISIDPQPSTEIANLVDKVYREPVETMRNMELLGSLKDRDILFIDSSHEIKVGNDVPFLYLIVIPSLPPGVLVHIHDVFLPYDYPKEWVMSIHPTFNEQYLVQSMLTYSSAFEVLWAGYFLQRTRPDFAQHFPSLKGRLAQSLWLRKTS